MTRIVLMILCLSCATVAQADPLLRIYKLAIQPGQQQAFDHGARQNLTASVTEEPGVLAMYATHPQNQPDRAWLFEIYAGEQAYQTHLASAHYRDYLAAAPGIVGEDQQLTTTVARYFGEKPRPLNVTTPQATPVMRYAEITLKPGTLDAFADIVINEMQISMAKEPGVLAMYAATVTGHPEQWRFVEIYADDGAYEQHRQTAHFKDYIARSAEMVADKSLAVMTNRVLVNKGGLTFRRMD